MKIRTNILNPVDKETTVYLPDVVIGIDGNTISGLDSYDPVRHKEVIDKRDCVCLPGLIDLHVHLSQYNIRGHYRPALLPWLSEVVFPEETKSKDYTFARNLASDFFNAMVNVGTTTAVIYTAPYKEACNTAFEIAAQKGFRAIMGMTLMDRNSPREMIQTTDYALESSISLFEKWHSERGLLDYIFTPRFAPTCSKELMQEIGSFCLHNNARIQTHLSENKDEIEWVKEIFGKESYTEVYQAFGILGKNTIMAHCIHLNDTELQILADNQTKIVHCPDSNFYLKSGEFPQAKITKFGIDFGLGSDVGAGTTLSMLYHAKMYNFRQSSYPVMPEEAFFRCTLGSAIVLNMQDRIGSIEVGKEADLVFVKTEPKHLEQPSSILSKLVFFGNEFPIDQVYIAGNQK